MVSSPDVASKPELATSSTVQTESFANVSTVTGLWWSPSNTWNGSQGVSPVVPLSSVRKQNSLHLFLKKTLQVAGPNRQFHCRTLGFGKQLFQNVLHYSRIEWGERVPLVPISW